MYLAYYAFLVQPSGFPEIPGPAHLGGEYGAEPLARG